MCIFDWHESTIYCYLETPDHVNRKLFCNCGVIDKTKCAWQVKMSLLFARSGDAYILMCYRRDIYNSNIWYIIINFIYHIHIVYDISQDLHVTSGLTSVYSLQLCYRENLWCEDNNVSGNDMLSPEIQTDCANSLRRGKIVIYLWNFMFGEAINQTTVYHTIFTIYHHITVICYTRFQINWRPSLYPKWRTFATEHK